MSFSKTFEDKLNSLFRQRTDWLRRELGHRGVGKPPDFSRGKVNAGIKELQKIASDALAHKLAKTEFNQHVVVRRNYHVKGRGYEDKREKFDKWFAAKFKRKTSGLIYAFWGNRNKCIYIGRTGSRGSRPSSHFDKFWFTGVKRVTIFQIRTKSQIPKLECMAIHHFLPIRNKNKAATKKWPKACPLCTTHKYIESELRDIFRFR